MTELLKRSFFGLIYVVVIILALQSYNLTALLLTVFLIVALKEFSDLVQLNLKTILFPSLLIYFSSFLYHSGNIEQSSLKIILSFTLIVLFIPMLFFIFDKFSKDALSKFYLTIFYLPIPFALTLSFDLKMLLFVFFIIWSSDIFAYLFGKFLGKHKLAEKISPKKTVEGFLGGLFSSLAIGFLMVKITDWYTDFDDIFLLILILIIVMLGTLGDLLESKFKRLAGVKDSGKILPGHGGILDRLDSFMLAIPFVYAYLIIFG